MLLNANRHFDVAVAATREREATPYTLARTLYYTYRKLTVAVTAVTYLG